MDTFDPTAGDAEGDMVLRFKPLPEGEPPFPLRAQDIGGADAVRYWTRKYLEMGGSTAVAELALRRADAMDAWPVKKLPDASHLSAGEISILQAAFAVRVWNDLPQADRKLREIHEARIRSEGFAAGKRSLRRTLKRMQDHSTGLRGDLVAADQAVAKAQADVVALGKALTAARDELDRLGQVVWSDSRTAVFDAAPIAMAVNHADAALARARVTA